MIKKCPPGERFNTLQVNSPARKTYPILSHLIPSQTSLPFFGTFSWKCLSRKNIVSIVKSLHFLQVFVLESMYVCDMSAKKCYWARKLVRQMRFNVRIPSET